MVVRPDQRSRSLVCVYLVDTFCLGVKNVIGPEVVSNKTLDKLRYTAFAGYDEPGVSAPLELAQHLVFGAVEFARGSGLNLIATSRPWPTTSERGRDPARFSSDTRDLRSTSRVHTTMLNPSRIPWPTTRRDKHWA